MIRRIYKILFALLLLMVTNTSLLLCQTEKIPWVKYEHDRDIDSIMKKMPVKEMVAQSIWVPAWNFKKTADYKKVEKLVTDYKVGGILFAEGKADKQLMITNHLDSVSKIPLIIATDAEWGTGMRLEGVENFPYQMTLGAIQNDSLLYQMGAVVAAECRTMGIEVNLAPVADVNNNPANPVINYRSFGENPDVVAHKTAMYMKGMQDNGVIACAKHFPGHGDTNVDSHEGLPQINVSRGRLDSLEFIPFRYLIDQGIGSVMTAHINVPSLDSTPNLPATYSKKIVTGILKNEMKFDGLVITDALSMKGAKNIYPEGVADAIAYSAGNDILEYSVDPEKAIDTITAWVNSGKIPEEVVKEKCRKILALKKWLSTGVKSKDTYGITVKNLSPSPKLALIRDLYANAVTLIENHDSIVPVKRLDKMRIATVSVNDKNLGYFREMTGRYTKVDHYDIDTKDTVSTEKTMVQLKNYDLVIAGISGLTQKPQLNFGITDELKKITQELSGLDKCIIAWFGNPFGISLLNLKKSPAGLLITYQDNKFTQEAAAEVIFGALGASGRLPVTINCNYPQGFGLDSPGNLRLSYGFPENAGMSSVLLDNKVDSIVKAGLDSMAFPGCEVLIARNGTIVYDKTFGYHTYDKTIPVRENDLFDLASVTKVSATTAALLMLNSEGLFDPDRTLGSYLPFFRNTNKDTLRLKDMLAHQSGLVPFIPFYKETINDDGTYKKGIYSDHYSAKFPVQVANSLYLNKNYRDIIFNEIRDSRLGARKYVYSDLNFLLSAEIVENITGMKLETYLPENIYHRLGAWDITYRPLEKYSPDQIIPTENDNYFRHQQLHGTVHDEGAAMLGGVAGHAGLFATGNDLIKLIETYRRMGSYGGEQIFSSEVMKKYTSVQFPENNNRRGLCFDKPALHNDTLPQSQVYPCRSASPAGFGHSGYTGTFVWVDPVAGISYVFLSNRVYPTRNNNKISDMNIRTNILEAAIEAIVK